MKIYGREVNPERNNSWSPSAGYLLKPSDFLLGGFFVYSSDFWIYLKTYGIQKWSGHLHFVAIFFRISFFKLLSICIVKRRQKINE
ncbi:hypothetical protein B0E44_10235 [Flavobacterium sp. A45]|nr:hypothetical protein B0E44_10235 [Flavobacterium sp. A45]